MLEPRTPDTWDSVFFAIAEAASRRSKDPSTQHGAVIVDPANRVVSLGFNGPPASIPDGLIDWDRPAKYPYVVHSETNAILFGLSARSDLAGCRLYVTGRPCSKCVLLMAAVRIGEVRFGGRIAAMCDEADWSVAQTIARLAGIKLTPANEGAANG